MSTEEKRGRVEKMDGPVPRRRKEIEEDLEVEHSGVRGKWEKFGKQLVLSFLFGLAVVFICFVGQDPPGLRTLGEVSPENVYSDRSFKYLSEVRKKEAEEWIRSSTPREFTRDFNGEKLTTKL